MFVVFLYAQYIVLIVVVRIEVGEVEVTVGQYHEDVLVVVELSEVVTVFLVVYTVDIRIEPHLPSTQRRVPVTLQSYAVDGFLRQQVTLRCTSFDQ